ncbi:MAG: hypothetical protein ACE5KZ_12065 [Candidatus Scalinduaceae bacterium]
MGMEIMYYSDSSIQVINNRKTIPLLSELVRTKCLAVRDWFEDRNSYYNTVNTHDYGTKVMLMNRLHNR